MSALVKVDESEITLLAFAVVEKSKFTLPFALAPNCSNSTPCWPIYAGPTFVTTTAGNWLAGRVPIRLLALPAVVAYTAFDTVPPWVTDKLYVTLFMFV